jgi:flagellar assembly factor FliW
MHVRTTCFGQPETLDVPEEAALAFAEGLPGFEDHTAFALIEDRRLEPFRWLQSLADQDVGFRVIEPAVFVAGYGFDLDNEDVARLELGDSVEPLVLSILVMPADARAMTANLRAPLVVNPRRGLGKQVILPDERYPLRHLAFTPAGEWNAVGTIAAEGAQAC